MWGKCAFSLLIMSVSVNCFATDLSDVLLQDIVVPNACTFENIGVYQGGVTMIPIYEDIIYKCGRGYFLPKLSEGCVICPENAYCSGGDYTYSETDDIGLVYCPEGLYAPTGMWEVAQCGRRFHVGDNVLFLRTVKKTEPALSVDVNQDGVADFYANLTTQNVPMNKDTDKRLKVKIDGVVLFVYDDTIDLTNNVSKD